MTVVEGGAGAAHAGAQLAGKAADPALEYTGRGIWLGIVGLGYVGLGALWLLKNVAWPITKAGGRCLRWGWRKSPPGLKLAFTGAATFLALSTPPGRWAARETFGRAGSFMADESSKMVGGLSNAFSSIIRLPSWDWGRGSSGGKRGRPQTAAGEWALAPGQAQIIENMSVEDIFYKGIIKQESGGNQLNAAGGILTSSAGAMGMAQVMPDTARSMGYSAEDLKDPVKNKMIGLRFFRGLVNHFNSKVLAIAAYNAGDGIVEDWINGTNKTKKNSSGLRLGDPRTGEVPVEDFARAIPYKETRRYVPNVARNLGIDVMRVGGNNYAQYVNAAASPQLATEAHYLGMCENANATVLNDFVNDEVSSPLRLDVTEQLWCAAFINAGERATGHPGSGSNLAESFRTYGSPVVPGQQQVGDIVILHSDHRENGFHVGRHAGVTPDGRPLLLSGNGNNECVDVKPYDPAKVVAYRRSI